ncbi:MAG: metallophosphoesterase [Pseudomonadales bacterium]|nr:metallophosphoesterase [Pseudomonadales bacterium]
MRLGLIADTHMPGAMEELWPQVFDAFEGADLILHAGDLHTLGVVRQLEQVAPVHVARGNGDTGIDDERLRDHWVLEFGRISVGMIHRFPSPQRRSGEQLIEYAARHFTATPDVIVYGHTHLEAIHEIDGRLYVNPGSPTLPRNQSLRPGTIGLMDIEDGSIEVTIMQLTEDGIEPHDEVAAIRKAFEREC